VIEMRGFADGIEKASQIYHLGSCREMPLMQCSREFAVRRLIPRWIGGCGSHVFASRLCGDTRGWYVGVWVGSGYDAVEEDG
jgi:hypothetical protein